MDFEQNKKDRKDQWLKKNSFKSQLAATNIIPLSPELGFYIKVDNIEISEDFFKEEYEQITEAYFSVIEKMDEYYKQNKKEKS